MLKLYESISAGRYDEALETTKSFIQFLRLPDAIFARYGAADAAYDSLIPPLTGFLQIGPTLRRPHIQVPDEAIDELRQVLAGFPEWDWSAERHRTGAN